MKPTPQVVIVLGGPIFHKGNKEFEPAFQTEMRVAAMAEYNKYHNKQLPTPSKLNFIITGGYNVGVRHSLSNEPLNEYSFQTFANARRIGPSEAYCMQQTLINKYDSTIDNIVLEEQSATTRENAAFCKLLLSRTNFVTTGSNPATVHLITNLFHMSRAIKLFQSDGIIAQPIYAEDYAIYHLRSDSPSWLDQIVQFYKVHYPKAYSIDKLHEILSERLHGSNRSVHELL